MSQFPTTASEVVNQLTDISIEYVDDIGLDEKFGLAISANLNDISVLGSVVIEDQEPDELNSSFHAYPDGMVNDAEQILTGEDAIEAVVILYDMYGNDEKPFEKTRQDVDLYEELN